MDISQLIQTVTVYALPVLFAITLHEAAHGYVARRFGDNTAWMLGRVTLNPIKHIDLIGTILMPILLLVLSQGKFMFGYAKPVPVNFGNLHRPKRDMIWVAAAGPVTNFLQAILWALLLNLLLLYGAQEPFFMKMADAGIRVNLIMWALNLFPLPPLDGGRILVGLLPWRQAEMVSRLEPYGFFIVLGLVAFGAISLWLEPLMAIGQILIRLILTPFFSLLG